MKYPSDFLANMQAVFGAEMDVFINSLENPVYTSVRMNRTKECKHDLTFSEKIPWTKEGYFLKERPAFVEDPLFHAGAYYVQESSSMFLEEVLKQLPNSIEPIRVLDLCAAPGGKSTHLYSLLKEKDVLVSNEIISNRNVILRENLAKWGAVNSIVTQAKAKDFANCGELFDLILVDAPCSGEGLFRKSKEAVGEWSQQNVNTCIARQKNILETIQYALKPNGYIVYSTCTFEEGENILQIKNLVQQENFKSIPLEISNFEGVTEIILDDCFGYSFYPHKVKGEGFFISLLQKIDTNATHKCKQLQTKGKPVHAEILMLVKDFADLEKYQVFQFGDYMYAQTKEVYETVSYLSNVHLKSAGVKMGECKGKNFIPAQELALSPLIKKEVNYIELDREQALHYLKTETFPIDAPKGWCVARFKNLNLGWCKVLENRFNNYYPKEWRIRKELF